MTSAPAAPILAATRTALPAGSPTLPVPARDARLSVGGRILALLLAALAASVLGVAAWMNPDPAGHGTHMELGLPPCGWAVGLGIPCPTCGMTTSFALAAEGHLLAAAHAQPFGLGLCLSTAAGFWGCLYVAATGSRLGEVCGRMLTGRVLWGVAALAAAAWAYKWVTWTT